MRISIQETREIKDLTAIGLNGIEWTADLVDAGGLKRDEASDAYIMTAESFKFWNQYIKDADADSDAIETLAAQMDLDEDAVRNRVYKACGNYETGQHHDARLLEIEAIMQENY